MAGGRIPPKRELRVEFLQINVNGTGLFLRRRERKGQERGSIRVLFPPEPSALGHLIGGVRGQEHTQDGPVVFGLVAAFDANCAAVAFDKLPGDE